MEVHITVGSSDYFMGYACRAHCLSTTMPPSILSEVVSRDNLDHRLHHSLIIKTTSAMTPSVPASLPYINVCIVIHGDV